MIFDVVQHDQLVYCSLSTDSLIRLLGHLTIIDPERVDLALARANDHDRAILVEGSGGDILFFIVQLFLELNLKASRVDHEFVFVGHE